MIDEHLETVRIVREDLEFLASLSSTSATEANVRHASVLLRRLLNEDLLIAAWKILRMEPRHPSITAFVIEEQPHGSEFQPHTVWNGGGITAGGQMVSLQIGRGAVSDQELKRLSSLKEPTTPRLLPLDHFKQSAALIIDGQKVSRRQFIDYMANKRGGVHLDRGRNRKKDDEVFKKLDQAGKETNIMNGMGPAFYQVLTIAQALVDANDVKRLLKEAEDLAAQHPAGPSSSPILGVSH
jgi:hypothetical protein